MHVIFVVNCWVDMKLLNRTQPTNLQRCSNQSTTILGWGERAPKNTFAPSPHICRSVPAWHSHDFLSYYILIEDISVNSSVFMFKPHFSYCAVE